MTKSKEVCIHGCKVDVVPQFNANEMNPDFYDVFDTNRNCLNEGYPFYTVPTDAQIELLLLQSGLTNKITLREKEHSTLLKRMPCDKVIHTTFGSSVNMIPPFEPEALKILAELRALG